MYKTKTLLFLLALVFTFSASAQVSVSTDNSLPDNSAMMDIKSNSKGLLIPRMSQSDRNLISQPANGLLIWQTDNTAGYYYNAGTAISPDWQRMGATGPQGVPGTSGVLQKYHVYGTAGRLAVSTPTPTTQPGMTQTFTLTSPATIVVWATIGARTTAATAGLYANVDMIIYADNNFLVKGGWNRFQVANAAAINSYNTCAINTSFTLPAGTHTIDLRTLRLAGGNTTVDIGGNSTTDINPGEMTIIVLN
jgi:hypothetical protein